MSFCCTNSAHTILRELEGGTLVGTTRVKIGHTLLRVSPNRQAAGKLLMLATAPDCLQAEPPFPQAAILLTTCGAHFANCCSPNGAAPLSEAAAKARDLCDTSGAESDVDFRS